MRWLRTDRVKLDDEIAAIFPIRDAELGAIATSMRTRGFDVAEPLVIWDEDGVLVDGHTRLAAAKQAGLERVYVEQRSFEDRRTAVEYAIARQRDRRNLSGNDLAGFAARAVAALDRVKTAGRPSQEKLAQGCANSGVKSSAETAERIGVSARTVEMIRTVQASDDEETKQALQNGETTINGAYQAVKQRQAAKQDSAPIQLTLVTAPMAPPIKAVYSVADWEALDPAVRAAIIRDAPATDDGRKAHFNQVNEQIDWAHWSWNPVTGCLHNCEYCYARDIAVRHYDQGFAPSFLPSRLAAPSQTRPPERVLQHMRALGQHPDGVHTRATDAEWWEMAAWFNVFVCSMADLFGNWVPQEWIDAVLARIRAAPQWNFLCLTKFPQRLAEIDWPANTWCGTSVDRQYRVPIAERSFRNVRAGVKWLSCEPLLEPLQFTSLEMFDWVVIGASSKSTQTPEFQPPWSWVEDLIAQARRAGCAVYVKPNLKSRPREFPPAGMHRRHEE